MNQSDDSPWPELTEATKGYRKGEILVITGGHGTGRSRLAEMAAAALIEQGHQVDVAGEIPEDLKVPEIPSELQTLDNHQHPYGKRHKPKKRKLRRKVGKL